jgi:hypothetical protein
VDVDMRGMRRVRSAGSVSVVLAAAVTAATLIGVLGSSAGSAALRISDGGAWLWSTARGWVTHVNGPSGRPDFNVPIPGSRGHRVELNQDGVSVLVSDLDTGVVSRIDPAGMGLLSRSFGPGSFRVVAGGDTAYIIQDTTGTITRIDPRTLDVIGTPVGIGAPVTGAGIAADGVLWVAVARHGQLVAVRDGRTIATIRVAAPGAQLTMTIADGRPVAVDASAPALVQVSTRTAGPATRLPPPAGSHPLLVAPTIEGRVIPVLVDGTAVLLLVDLDANAGHGTVRTATLAGQNPTTHLGAPIIAAGRVYIPDNGSARVLVYDRTHGRFDAPIRITGGPGMLTVFVRSGSVWINNTDGSDAVAVTPEGRQRRVNKYSPDVPIRTANITLRIPPPPVIVPAAPQVIIRPVAPAQPGRGAAPQPNVPPPGRSTRPTGRPVPVPPVPVPPETTAPPPPATPPPSTTPPPTPPGVPTVRALPASAAVAVTVEPPAAGGPVTAYTLTVTTPPTAGGPGTSTIRALTAPGTVTVPVAGCATATATATATGPGGTSPASPPTQALGCIPPGPVRNMTLTVGPPVPSSPSSNLLLWDPPADTGGGTVDYVVTISYSAMGTCCPARDVTQVVTGTSYQRAPAAGRDPYNRISVAARNAAGTGPAVVGYPRGG